MSEVFTKRWAECLVSFNEVRMLGVGIGMDWGGEGRGGDGYIAPDHFLQSKQSVTMSIFGF